MRQYLLALVPLLPVACNAAIGAPDRTTKSKGPIIEHGEGCSAQMAGGGGRAIATGAPGGFGGYKGEMMDDAPAPAEMGGMDRAKAPAAPRPAAPPSKPSIAKSDMPAPVTGRPPIEQPSGVRAGEWDDNANYRDYINWLGQKANPENKGKIDTSGREFLVVTDADGKAVPNCSISIGGKKLVTMASGRALLFPKAMGLTGDKLTATAQCGNSSASATFTPELDGVVQLKLDSKRVLPAKRTLDLAFVIDTTGSMSEEIAAVKQTVNAVSEQLSNSQTDVRIGLVEYKDRSDCLLTRTFPFSSDYAAFGQSVANITADGGGDMPEDMHAGLNAALDKLEWRDSAAARMVVVIGDAPPHFYEKEHFYDDVSRRAASRGIKLYTVAASGMDDLGQVVMRQMAQFTGATNMFVLRGGAGPQSVGGGDPQSSCGGTHQEYSSGKLDQLIMRKVKIELASIDADPLKIPGRGKDENAKPCNERLVVAN